MCPAGAAKRGVVQCGQGGQEGEGERGIPCKGRRVRAADDNPHPTTQLRQYATPTPRSMAGEGDVGRLGKHLVPREQPGEASPAMVKRNREA